MLRVVLVAIVLVNNFVVAIAVALVFDFMNVDLVEVASKDVVEAEFAVVEGVAAVVDTMDAFVVVVSHSLQVLAQCVTLATRPSHKPKFLKAMHWLCGSVSFLP